MKLGAVWMGWSCLTAAALALVWRLPNKDLAALVGALVILSGVMGIVITSACMLPKSTVVPQWRLLASIPSIFWLMKGMPVMQGLWCGFAASHPWALAGLYVMAEYALGALAQGPPHTDDDPRTRPGLRTVLVSVASVGGGTGTAMLIRHFLLYVAASLK